MSMPAPGTRFHIARIAINKHHRMYDELIDALLGGLGDLGHVCTTARNEVVPGAVNILVGSTIFATGLFRLADRLRGAPYLIYQLEPLHDTIGLFPERPDYADLLKGAARIWDYAPSSAAYLRARGFTGVSELPPAHHPCLERFEPASLQDIDVLFVGSIHPRRAKIIEQLRAAGAKVVHLDEFYGRSRDEAFARAKIVLNMHAWEGVTALETVRLSYLLANKCFVVSEVADHDPYGGGLVYAEYGHLASTCLDWLGNPAAERRAIAEQGGDALRKIRIAEGLDRVLADLDMSKATWKQDGSPSISLTQPQAAALETSLADIPEPISRQEGAILHAWSREGSGVGIILLAGDLPAGLAPWMAAGCAKTGRAPPLTEAELGAKTALLRLLVLGGKDSYAECGAALRRWLGQVEDCGALAIYGVGSAPGATRLHEEILRDAHAMREVCRSGSLRIFAAR